MGARDRRNREREETRQKILGAAREMFSERGYEAVTMRAIGDRIEYTPTAIYHHFENKHALLTELCNADFEALARQFNRAAPNSDPVERIMAVGEAYLGFARTFPSQYRFMFMTVIPEGGVRDLGIRGNPERDAYAFLREACRAAIMQGRFRPEITDPDRLAQILWSNVHGLISLHIVKGREEWIPWRDLRATARQSMGIMMCGLLREARPTKRSR